jgi:hypothetical protein
MLRNSELNINQNCNLKWGLGDKAKYSSPVQALLVKTAGKPL